MCGIAGIFHVAVPKPVDPTRVEAMADMLVHRGPDGGGVWTAPGVGLGHRRLSIVDPEGGAQPMLSGDGKVALTHDGEIYNFREVRAELEGLGHAFRTDSDAEIILAGWRQWGPECLSRLDGMFAFALYDGDSDSLFLARDRLGEKPLYFADLPDGALIFASELKGLLAHPLLQRRPSPQAVEDYLALGYVPDDVCMVEGVRKLAAGNYLHIKRGKPVPAPMSWWDVDFSSPSSASAVSLEEELAEHLRRAVRSRMEADVPLGAFLSGSVDSAAVVAFMAEASRAAVETSSVGFADTGPGETDRAKLVAERFATSHRTRFVEAEDFGLIGALAAAFDEPFADASALATYRSCELAREKVRVSLSGEGADEVFAGHSRYRVFTSAERLRRLVPRAAHFFPGMRALGRSGEEAYADALETTSKATRTGIYGPGLLRDLHGHRAEDRYVRAMKEATGPDPLSRVQYADLKISLPGESLTRMDRMSMAVGLEVRQPFLDHRLVEFAARLPAQLRLGDGTGKWLLKEALGRYLPAQILRRPEKKSAAPLASWFRGALADEAAAVARGPAFAGLGWFDGPAIARLAADHRSGRAEHGQMLWQLLMLEKSLQRLFGLGASSSYTAAVK